MAVIPAMQLGPNHKYCPSCATVLDARAPFCAKCGAPQTPAPGMAPAGGGKPKSKLAAALLAFFLGGVGVHRFYLGQWGWGLLMLFFWWTAIPSLVAFVDFIRYLVMSEEEFQRRYGDLGGGTVAAVVAGAVCVLVGVGLVGILAAIAIPNFLRYQLRAKDVGTRAQLQALVTAQEAQLEGGSPYLLPPGETVPEDGELGPAPLAWSDAERAWAEELGWPIPQGQTLARFSIAVNPTETGSASFCAETDLDGDGTRAAWVAFRPRAVDGEVEAPPPAPCSEDVALADDLALEYPGDGSMNVAVRVSPPDVF